MPRRSGPYNPLTRVPTLVLDDGEVLIESHSILDYLDSLVPAERRMFPAAEPARHQALKVAALATGMAEKAVSLFYEKALHKETSDVWVSAAARRSPARSPRSKPIARRAESDYWFGDRIGHADIAVAVRAALHRAMRIRALSRWRIFRRSPPRRAARGAAGVPGDRAGVHPAGVNPAQ